MTKIKASRQKQFVKLKDFCSLLLDVITCFREGLSHKDHDT